MSKENTCIEGKQNEEYITKIRKIKCYQVNESGVVLNVVYEDNKNT